MQDQQQLAVQHAGNRLLELRGNAGSHDVQLGTTTLEALRAANSSTSAPFAIPRYNKSLNSGRGDRAPQDSWPQVLDAHASCGGNHHTTALQADDARMPAPVALSQCDMLGVAVA